MSEVTRPPSDDPGERKEAYLAKVSHVQMGLAPRNFEEGLRMAELYCKTTMVPPEYRGNPGNTLMAIELGMTIGLSPSQALQAIMVVNSRPSLWGDGMLGVVIASPVFEWIDEKLVDGVATCTVKRRNWPTPVVRTFSMDDAKKAGLWNKTGPWQTNPNRMLQMRARAFALRDVFADVLRGIASAEEMLDVTAQGVVETKIDPEVAIRNDLAGTPEQWAEIVALWEKLATGLPRRILLAKQYAGRAADLIEALTLQVAPPIPAAIEAPPKVVTKHTRRRFAKAQAEATAPVVSAGPPPDEAAKAVCEHGVLIDEPCDVCVSLADALAAEATAAPEPKPVPETAKEYAARRKRELADLNKAPF